MSVPGMAKIRNLEVNQSQPLFELFLDQIIRIQESYSIAQALVSDEKALSDTGFFISSHKRCDFINFLESGGKVFVGLNELETVQGYCFSDLGKTFKVKHPQTQIQWNSESYKHRYEEKYSLGNFIYLDQVGVERAYQGRGVASYMVREFEKTVRSELILAAVLREPIYNARSHYFLIKEGYLAVADFYTKELNGLSGVRSTVFIKEKSKL